MLNNNSSGRENIFLRGTKSGVPSKGIQTNLKSLKNTKRKKEKKDKKKKKRERAHYINLSLPRLPRFLLYIWRPRSLGQKQFYTECLHYHARTALWGLVLLGNLWSSAHNF